MNESTHAMSVKVLNEVDTLEYHIKEETVNTNSHFMREKVKL